MLKRINGLFAAAGALALLFSSIAAAEPIGAKAVYVQGKVTIIHMDGKEVPVKTGDPLAEGDTVKTGANGALEIEYDNGDLTAVDKNAVMVIKSLSRSGGSSFSIFGLVAGRIKSSVSKLMSKDSKFEYHTKSAVAGVAGTPPFVVAVSGNITSVDLVGAKGERGSVYVKGTDPRQTMVMVMIGERTMAQFGKPPASPFLIDPNRFRTLQQGFPFRSRGDSTSGGGQPQQQSGPDKKEEPGDKTGGKPGDNQTTPGGGGKDMVVGNISSNVSTLMQTGPSGANDASKRNMTTTSKQGSIGGDSGAGVQADQPPPFATGTISLTFQ